MNGNVETYGNRNNLDATKKSIINLDNSIITAVYTQHKNTAGTYSIQFGVLNRKTFVYTLTPQNASTSGNSYKYDFSSSAPTSTLFKIVKLSGAFDSFYLRSWYVSSSYLQCHPTSITSTTSKTSSTSPY